MNIKWDAETYTENFSFVHQYGAGVLELIDKGHAKAVLDLGCGNGALSGKLADLGFEVTGLDASKEQLDLAKKQYPDIHFIQADATAFQLESPVDVVFSNAVFHWIDREKQPDLLRCVHRVLKENGQFVFEFGGSGNNTLIHEALAKAFSEHGYAYQMPFYFPTIGEYATLLEAAGFQVRYATLFDRPTQLSGEEGLKDWIHMFVKTPFAVVKHESEREEIIGHAVDSLRGRLYRDKKWYADYVRLRMKAVKEPV